MKRQKTLEGNIVPNKEELRQSEEFANKLVWALFGPVITTPSTVGEVSKDQNDKATLSRLASLCQDGKVEEATDYEAMLYLSNLSLEHVPGHRTYTVYSYLFCKLYPEQAKEVFGDHVVSKLEYIEEELLRKLKKDIYKSQMEHIKQKRKV